LPGSGATGVAIWGGALVVMPRGCRLWLNLVTKYRTSGVVCDSRIHYLGRSIIASVLYYFNKWYQELWLDWIYRRYGDHYGGARIMLDGRYGTARCGARWSMVAIDDSIGGVRHSEQEAWTVQRVVIGEDRPGAVIRPTQWPLKTTRSGRRLRLGIRPATRRRLRPKRLEHRSITTTVM
jgi:hypothetical protein